MTPKQEQRANQALQQEAYLAKEEFSAEMTKAHAKNDLWKFASDLAVRAGKTSYRDILEFSKEIVEGMDTFKEAKYKTPEPTIKPTNLILP